MTTTEFLEKHTIKSASKLTEEDRVRICKHILAARDKGAKRNEL